MGGWIVSKPFDFVLGREIYENDDRRAPYGREGAALWRRRSGRPCPPPAIARPLRRLVDLVPPQPLTERPMMWGRASLRPIVTARPSAWSVRPLGRSIPDRHMANRTRDWSDFRCPQTNPTHWTMPRRGSTFVVAVSRTCQCRNQRGEGTRRWTRPHIVNTRSVPPESATG